jgi:hypothetical protein
LNVRGGFRERSCGASADGNVGTFTGQFLRDGTAKPLAGSRDDGNAACKPQIHSYTASKTFMVSRNGGRRQCQERQKKSVCLARGAALRCRQFFGVE